jgi:nicotinamidase-related amidase
MSQPSLLISQCLQNDFVKPLGKFASMPNQLHIGGEEARRLIGEDPEQGPIARLMQWAYAHPQDELAIVHIRDAHDPDDRTQIDHLRQFGPHCLQGTEGAEFAFPTPDTGREAIVVESQGLNDFIGTTLEETLASVGVRSGKAGVTGVWTEAKVFFLCYDLRTRYPDLEIGVCSALTASSSRAQHFIALDQLSRLLGVKVFSSVGAFTSWLGGEELSVGLPTPSYEEQLKIEVVGDANITDVDERLIRFLFRDCREVRLRVLDGGYSGNLVLGAASRDFHGHDQVLHVVKIGEQELMGQERTAFEHVEEVLGNNAPSITEFADLEGRGALKYRYAAMGAGGVRTLQQIYEEGQAPEKTEFYLQTVFGDQLGRFYRAAELEWCNLLEYYWFSPERAGGVRENVEAILGTPADGPTLQLPSGHSFPNPCVFYEQDLEEIYPHATRSTYFSYLHGDLNGANIMVDAQDNVWLIDFFHTHRGHVLKDLIKFENDLLYIYTKLDDEDDLADAIQLFEGLMTVEDLARPLPSADEVGITGEKFRRTWETLQILRSFYPKLVTHDREPLHC